LLVAQATGDIDFGGTLHSATDQKIQQAL